MRYIFADQKSCKAILSAPDPAALGLFRVLCGLLLLFCFCAGEVAQAQVSGTVFRDFNASGTKDANEPGVSSLTVMAFYNGTSSSVVSNTAGAYSFGAGTIASGTSVRLEFSVNTANAGEFSGPFSSAAGGNGTSVQFVTAGTTNPASILPLTHRMIFAR